ncbi:gag-pol polyprotein, partial [Trifolium medium]|nr:gag-pol polyprotein [Trifolium medium]
MLHAKNLPHHFWAEAMNTACHIHNRVTLRTGTSSTLYELWKGRKPTVKYFHVFDSKCYILADREQRRKMDPKSDEGIFLGYSTNSRAYRVFNSRTRVVMESINVVVDDSSADKELDVEDDVGTSCQPADISVEVDIPESTTQQTEEVSLENKSNKGPSIRVQKNHPKELIIGNLNEGLTTR